MTDLPPGWRVVSLGEVADTALGKMLDKGKSRGFSRVPYLRNVNVQWGRIDTHDLLTMELDDDERERFRVAAGDLLACEGGDIGRAAIWPGRPEYLAYQKALHRIRVRDALHVKYLRYYLEHAAKSGQLAKLSTGSTIAHLPQQALRRVPVPLPNVREQRQIVEILEDRLSRLDAAYAEIVRASKRSEAFLSRALSQAIAAAAGDRVTLGEVARWSSGGTPPTSDRANYEPGTIPWLNSGDLNNSIISMVPRQISGLGLAKSSAKWVESGSVLVAMYGATIGKVGLTTQRLTTNQAVASAVPDRTKLAPEYLFWFLRASARELASVGQGGAQPNISQRILKSWPIVVPELAEQCAVIEKCEAIDRGCQRLKIDLELAGLRSGVLRRAVLAAAFSGKLTGRRTDDEIIEETAEVAYAASKGRSATGDQT